MDLFHEARNDSLVHRTIIHDDILHVNSGSDSSFVRNVCLVALLLKTFLIVGEFLEAFWRILE